MEKHNIFFTYTDYGIRWLIRLPCARMNPLFEKWSTFRGFVKNCMKKIKIAYNLLQF